MQSQSVLAFYFTDEKKGMCRLLRCLVSSEEVSKITVLLSKPKLSTHRIMSK